MALQIATESSTAQLAVSPDGKHLAVLDSAHHLLIRELPDGKIMERAAGVDGDSITFSPDSRRLFINSADTPPMIWDIDADQAVPLPAGISAGGKFTADGTGYWEYKTVEQENNNYLGRRSELLLWHLADGKVVHTVPGMIGKMLLSTGTIPAPSPSPQVVMAMGEQLSNTEFVAWTWTRARRSPAGKSPSAPLTFPDSSPRTAANSRRCRYLPKSCSCGMCKPVPQ